MLKLKTYCWNHYSKIIFKCVNSTVRPIFNEKVAKKWNLWVYKQYIMHCFRQKSQHLRLLFIKQYMNSNRVLPKRVKKKKKNKNKNAKRRRSKRGSKHTLTYSESIFNGIIMIILDIRTWYNFYGLNCQKGKKKKKSTSTLKCLFYALDPLRFRAWHALIKLAHAWTTILPHVRRLSC